MNRRDAIGSILVTAGAVAAAPHAAAQPPAPEPKGPLRVPERRQPGRPMPQSPATPVEPEEKPTDDARSRCLRACFDCVDACGSCRVHCMETAIRGNPVFASVAALCADCMDVSSLTGVLVSRKSTVVADMCEACARVCGRCADACEALRDDQAQACAKVCRACAEACKSHARASGK